MESHQYTLLIVAMIASFIVLCFIIPYEEDNYTYINYQIEIEELKRENRVLLQEIEYLEKVKDSTLWK